MDEETEAQQGAQEHLKWQPEKVHYPYTTSETYLLLFKIKLCNILWCWSKEEI